MLIKRAISQIQLICIRLQMMRLKIDKPTPFCSLNS